MRRRAFFFCLGFGSAGHFGSVAQLAPKAFGDVCGKAEGANPFGSAIFLERSSVFRALVAVRKHLGTGRPQVKILLLRPFQNAAVAEIGEAFVF